MERLGLIDRIISENTPAVPRKAPCRPRTPGLLPLGVNA
jgi:hypothetical protein